MKVFVNAFWLTSCRIAADLLSFVLFAAIARDFGPNGTGEYSYGFAVGTLVALVSTCGFEDFGIRAYASATTQTRPQLWADMLATQCVQLGVGVLVFIAFLLVGALHARNLIVLTELGVYVVCWWMSRTFFIPAMASQSMKAPAITDLACRFAAIVSALLIGALTHASLPLMLAGFPLAGVALLLLSLASARRHGARLQAGRSWRRTFDTLRRTLPFAGSDLLNQFYARADVLLIAYFLGNASVGLYATDIKFIEVGLLPLILLGTASYPVMSAYAARSDGAFAEAARDFMRILLLLTGWLAVGIFCLVPLLIVPLFGPHFSPAIPLLPWIALFAILKGVEATLYRLLYSAHRQTLYCISLLIGTVLIVSLNVLLIPTRGLKGAIVAAIVSTIVVDAISLTGLVPRLGARFIALALLRLTLATLLIAALVGVLRHSDFGLWTIALAACAAFPLAAAVFGLLPNPRTSTLLRPFVPSDSAAPS
jgi:O-antigen/teichoic acid export membrane protein